MQIFNFKRLLGLMAVGGGIAYVRKQGGLGNAVESVKKLLGGVGGVKTEDKAVGSDSTSGSDSKSPLPSAPVTPSY